MLHEGWCVRCVPLGVVLGLLANLGRIWCNNFYSSVGGEIMGCWVDDDDTAVVAVLKLVKVLGSAPAIVLDQRFDAGAKLGPGLVRVVGLPVSVRHAAVTLVLGIGEGHYNDVFDGIVGRLVVLEGAGGMESKVSAAKCAWNPARVEWG